MTQVKNLQGDTLEKSQTEQQKRSPEIQERYDNETVSATGLSYLASSPKAYRNYKDKQDESTETHFEIGKAIHMRVLEPEKFDEHYYVMEAEAPGDGTNMRIFIDRYFHYTQNEFDPEMAKEMAYKESGYKTKFDTVWKNFEEKENYVAYWDALNDSAGKIILSPKDELVIENCFASIMNHKVAEALFNIDPTDGKTYLTEEDIRWKMPSFDFQMRSILDRAIIDPENKVVNIIDLKTTSKNVHKFEYSYENFSYYRQMAFYGHAVMWYIENVLNENRNDWAITTAIVAVQTNGFHETAVYAPSPTDMHIGHDEILNLLTRMEWHFDNDKWDFPMEYYTSGGITPISLDPSKYGYSNETRHHKEVRDSKNDENN
jgi:hypothetical protein